MLLPDLPALERDVAASWARSGLAGRLAARRANGTCWPLAAPPFAARGVPGIHEAGIRTISDVYFRFKAMRGYRAPPRTGLDCHGLGVEIAVAGELGLAGPGDIEAYGVGPFLTRCRESALRHASAWYSVSSRLGWLSDDRPARRTMDAEYLDYVWGSLARLFDANLLRRDHRVGRYCPRCQTQLAEHELHRPGGFRTVNGTALIVRFRLDTLPEGASRFLGDADLLVRTSAPWTLAACRSVTVNAEETYAIARRAGHDERVVIAESQLYQVLGVGWHVIGRVTGRELAGATCRLAYPRAGISTGSIALAPEVRGPVADPETIGPDGCFVTAVPRLHGLFFADADLVITKDLADRGLLFSSAALESRRPHCWRCGAPLLNRMMRSWYLTVGTGPDWALSRTRYWGTPLPFWECPDGHLTRAGSLAELSELAGRDLSDLDPHYPALAGLSIRCPRCDGTASWIAEIVDAAYETGLMPFTQYDDTRVKLAAGDPDQAPSWHYATAALGRLLRGREPERVATWSGQVTDARGRRMSQYGGNLADPLPLIERHGADAVRWYFASLTPRQGRADVADKALSLITRRILHRYLRVVLSCAGPDQHRPVLDRWLLSESQVLVREVTAALESFRCDVATRRLTAFIRDLSRWHPHLSRPALRDCLKVLTRLMAPFAPFLADHGWGLIHAAEAPGSVHLTSWPEVRAQLLDSGLSEQMTQVRCLVRAGRATRAAALIPPGQSVARAWIPAASHSALDGDLLALIAAELNVQSVEAGAPTELPDGSLVVLDLSEGPPAAAHPVSPGPTPERRRHPVPHSGTT
jgi:isoleucyl-tRNA synthetase